MFLQQSKIIHFAQETMKQLHEERGSLEFLQNSDKQKNNMYLSKLLNFLKIDQFF